jgi:hypothetical protein
VAAVIHFSVVKLMRFAKVELSTLKYKSTERVNKLPIDKDIDLNAVSNNQHTITAIQTPLDSLI